MKKIFLLLTLTVAQLQSSLPNSNYCTNQILAEISEKDSSAEEKKQPTWREYCENKISSAQKTL